MPIQDHGTVPSSTRFATEGVPNYNSRDFDEGKNSAIFFTEEDILEKEETFSF
jgi:hypothetical protein